MQRNPVPALVLAAALSACAVHPESLNSERIERRFGNYGIEILKQDHSIRRSNLYSTHDGVRICRTYAIVDFVDSNLVHASEVHSKVIDGASIGATFKADGWDISKDTVYIGEIELPESSHPIAELMQLDSAQRLAVHAYELHIEKSATSIHYATIIELHHPDYLDVGQLRELFPAPDDRTPDTPTHIQQLVLAQHHD